MDLLSELNESQAEAVRHTEGPLLVLAGAGAGKTRVITYRIAHLIEQLHIAPWNILAVTFTNKAAGEMKQRLRQLVGEPAKKVWMGTFHSIGLNILRQHGDKTVAGENASVVDQDDRLGIIKTIAKELGLDIKKYPPKRYLALISDYKNTIFYVENRPPEELAYRFGEIFHLYESSLRSQHLIDFDDMLSLSLRLFLQHPNVRDKYRELSRYILVDEYQDTNAIQFAFLKELSGDKGNICVVGDDDQSIYSWRGANVENILYFDSHFKGVKEVKLVDNYRSAPQILNAANRLIGNNTARRGKDLRAQPDKDGKVTVQKALDERYEAMYVADMIEQNQRDGIPLTEIAILYRTNAQSRNFEVELNRRHIPYKVVGGVGFYQRREIKDILSYLRVLENPYDEASFARALKTPPRGAGDTVIEHVREYALAHNMDMLSAAETLIPTLAKRAAQGLSIFRNIMHNLVSCGKISEMIQLVVDDTGYKDYLILNEDAEEAKARAENVDELYNAALIFEEQAEANTLADFLATATLVTSSDEESKDTVKLMSLHGAKGLEFESVYVTGMEKGIFPLLNKDSEVENMEEERRLCYVGATRAKRLLTFTYTNSRMYHGKRDVMQRSNFLEEIGAVANTSNAMPTSSRSTSFASAGGAEGMSDGHMRKGQLVSHDIFGDGIVMDIDGNGDSAKVTVLFKKSGMKKLVARFLKMV
jgi:DNA helicase-2/ATP-dependent DNA helicase PcrA